MGCARIKIAGSSSFLGWCPTGCSISLFEMQDGLYCWIMRHCLSPKSIAFATMFLHWRLSVVSLAPCVRSLPVSCHSSARCNLLHGSSSHEGRIALHIAYKYCIVPFVGIPRHAVIPFSSECIHGRHILLSRTLKRVVSIASSLQLFEFSSSVHLACFLLDL